MSHPLGWDSTPRRVRVGGPRVFPRHRRTRTQVVDAHDGLIASADLGEVNLAVEWVGASALAVEEKKLQFFIGGADSDGLLDEGEVGLANGRTVRGY